MASCKNCGKMGFFLKVDGNGLCPQCVEAVLPILVNDCRIVIESGAIIQKSKNERTVISRCEVGLAALRRIAPYERKGIPALSEPASEVASEFRDRHCKAIDRLVEEQVFLARSKQESASTPAGKLGGYTKAIDKLNKMLLEFEDISQVEPAIAELVRERDKVSISMSWLKAEKLLTKGKLKQAVDALKDALVDIKYDTTPDYEQAEDVASIEAKIHEIEASLSDHS